MKKITFKQFLKQKGYDRHDIIEIYGVDMLHELRDEYNEKYNIIPKIIKMIKDY